jgi:hypothetical protein
VPKLVVLISGKQGSGKTTLRENLISKISHDLAILTTVEHYSFARPVYDAAAAVQAALHEKYGLTILQKDRALLQVIGTEWGRSSRGENVWVDCAREFVSRSKADIIVIDDCRFPNELLAEFGCPTLKVRLNASLEVRALRAQSAGGHAHPSESALDDHEGEFDMAIDTQEVGATLAAECVEEAVQALLRVEQRRAEAN